MAVRLGHGGRGTMLSGATAQDSGANLLHPRLLSATWIKMWKAASDTKAGWEADMEANRIKFYKNLGRTDGSGTNRVTVTGLRVSPAASRERRGPRAECAQQGPWVPWREFLTAARCR